jgi:glycosyltransferase involved in cell wall biosynthesis
MNTQILFSVIIPTFNRLPFLKKAIDSVLSQSYSNFELIVVDDGSTDGTSDLLATYEDNRLISLYQENSGVSSARNKALNIAKGDFIAFLDSDDWWEDNKLQRTIDYIKDFPRINIFHTEELWYRSGKLLNQKKKHKKPSGEVYIQALPLCCISISTVAIKKVIFNKVGLFDETLEACEDYDFWLRTTSQYEVKLIPEYLTLKDGGREDQLSSSVWGLDRFRIKALEKILASNTLSKEYRDATFNELSEKCKIFALGSKKRGKLEEVKYYQSLPERYQRERA